MAAAERKHQVPVLGAQGQVPKEEARIHEDAQFEYLNDLSPMLDVAGPGAKGYTFLRGFCTEIVSESWCAPALPIREDETRAMLDHAGRVLADASSRDRTRHEVM